MEPREFSGKKLTFRYDCGDHFDFCGRNHFCLDHCVCYGLFDFFRDGLLLLDCCWLDDLLSCRCGLHDLLGLGRSLDLLNGDRRSFLQYLCGGQGQGHSWGHRDNDWTTGGCDCLVNNFQMKTISGLLMNFQVRNWPVGTTVVINSTFVVGTTFVSTTVYVTGFSTFSVTVFSFSIVVGLTISFVSVAVLTFSMVIGDVFSTTFVEVKVRVTVEVTGTTIELPAVVIVL